MRTQMTESKGFTLIELLIVVAIIAILAAIAVPNFLEAQTRSKVSRVRSDQRTMATALEAYYVDYNAYPQCAVNGAPLRDPDFGDEEILERLSTPVAYITNAIIRDVFEIDGRFSAATAQSLASSSVQDLDFDDPIFEKNSMIYQAWMAEQRATVTTGGFEPFLVPARSWLIHSAGPDGKYHNLGGVLANDFEIDGPILLLYDPTNGTISFGSIYKMGGQRQGTPQSSLTGDPYAGGLGLFKAVDSQQ